jgi:2-methylcitrate dehydratase
MIRVLDYNDIYWKQDPSHPSDLIPAALSVGEREHRSGKEVITAIVLAYEFEQRLCEFAIPGIRERKWHHATFTQFVSPIVAGKMLGLNAEQMTHAIGISACHNLTLGAVTAGKLTMMKNTVDPLAVQSGVMAALMAQKGYTGPEAIFEGKEGLLDTFGGQWDLNKLTQGLGQSFQILQCSLKAFPTEALTHSPLTATLKVVKENNIKAEEVEEVTVKTIARAVDILADPPKYKPTSKETADHSLPYCIAAAIADGGVTTAQFTEEKLKDLRILKLISKVKAVADPELEKLSPALKPSEVVIRTQDGKEYTSRVNYPKGDPREPMSEQELDNKFDGLTANVITPKRRERIANMIWNLEKVKDIGELMGVLVVDM